MSTRPRQIAFVRRRLADGRVVAEARVSSTITLEADSVLRLVLLRDQAATAAVLVVDRFAGRDREPATTIAHDRATGPSTPSAAGRAPAGPHSSSSTGGTGR